MVAKKILETFFLTEVFHAQSVQNFHEKLIRTTYFSGTSAVTCSGQLRGSHHASLRYMRHMGHMRQLSRLSK
jgi:hypothetical protein